MTRYQKTASIWIFIAISFPAHAHAEENLYQWLYSGQYDSLRIRLENRIKLDSTHAELYFLLGMADTYQNKNSDALKHFQSAYDFDPNHIKNLNHYARALLNNGYLSNADAYTPAKEIIYYEMANVYYDYYDDRSVALMYYKKSCEYDLDPEVLEFIDYRTRELNKEIFFNK